MILSNVIIFFMCILSVGGINWYSITDNSGINKIYPIKGQGTNTNGHRINDQKYFSRVKDDNNFKPSDPLQISFIKSNAIFIPKNVSSIKPNNESVQIRNTIENTNVVHINRPRKKLRRRCPQFEGKPKSLNFHESSEGRFLEVFEVVQFDHVSCSTDNGLEGTCLHEYDCQKSGGTAMGTCADGYGSCCVTIFNCEGRSSAKVGWFNNPGYPSTSSERLSCTFTLDKFSNDIKQIRLDFIHFEILPPTAGICELDQFLVLGQNVNNKIPILCGINSGQHVYVEVLDDPIILTMQTVTAENRLFSIKVTQLAPLDNLAAPTGCLQFFKEDHGHIESFNYRERSEIGITRTPSYLNNLNYAICIERAAASCSITYTNAGEMQIVNYDTDGLPVIPPLQAGVEILNCPSDWLLIAALRLCGERLNDGSINQDFTLDAPVTDDGAGPIVVWFRSDSIYSGRGFQLYYKQNSCSS